MGSKAKFPAVIVEPAGVFTRIFPVVAFGGTTTEIAPLLSTVNEGAFRLLIVSPSVPRRLVPVITRLVPARPLAGENPVMVGGTKKLLLLSEEPREEETRIGPVVTPAGALTWRRVSDCTKTPVPNTPSKVTCMPVPTEKWAPSTSTSVPPDPTAGLKPLT